MKGEGHQAHRELLSRPFAVAEIPRRGLKAEVVASDQERARIAAEFDLTGLASLKGSYRLEPKAAGIRVTGEVTARLTRMCVVSLEAFDTELVEPVELSFAPQGERGPAAGAFPAGEITISVDDEDPPEAIVDGKIDLGMVTLEFMALGLDAYPRQPGIELALPAEPREISPSPFAMLAKLAVKEPGED